MLVKNISTQIFIEEFLLYVFLVSDITIWDNSKWKEP